MKAAVMRGLNQPLQVEDIQVDNPGYREVLIRTGASGVCHSDLHFLEGSYPVPTPCVLGHEASGTVEAVGEHVTYVQPGDRVITCLSVFCGNCHQCMMGRPGLCNRTEVTRSPSESPRLSKDGERINQFINLSSFAEQMLVHEQAVVKVRDDVPFEQLALVGCGVITGVGAVLNTARIQPGSTVAVIGCGGVGLSSVQGALIAGAGRIIAIDVVKSKLEMARQFGATDLVDASDGGVVERVREMTGGGVDYSFEAIGAKETAEQAFQMLGDHGTATLIGMIPQGMKIELEGSAFLRERRIQGSVMGSNRFRIDMPRYIEYYRQGRLKLDEMISQRLHLQGVNGAFDDMKNGNVARSVILFD